MYILLYLTLFLPLYPIPSHVIINKLLGLNLKNDFCIIEDTF